MQARVQASDRNWDLVCTEWTGLSPLKFAKCSIRTALCSIVRICVYTAFWFLWSTTSLLRKFEWNAGKRTEESRRCDRLMEHVVYTGLQQCWAKFKKNWPPEGHRVGHRVGHKVGHGLLYVLSTLNHRHQSQFCPSFDRLALGSRMTADSSKGMWNIEE